jgi:hypothetical protein
VKWLENVLVENSQNKQDQFALFVLGVIKQNSQSKKM